ncbi:MAG TPA: PilN domain-containing protein [Candidatus Sulfopaludibacter sp.]|jgi:Tfp pilus assembly protein PilN|nr:PilN domain-containing protein [Candidatus Sulfopaludibacter sp.]
MALQTSISKDFRKLMSFGFGVGVEIGATDLEVVAARVRPTGIQVLGRLTIANYAGRPAAEWGGEYGRFLKSMGASHLSATVLLPRRDVIVRQLALPGVSAKDIDSAIRFQLDSLHPYGDEEICSGWSPLAYGAVLVGIARQSTVTRYVQLFSEAGVTVSSFTFSAAAVHAAIRLNGHANGAGFVALSPGKGNAVEVYGESVSRPVFCAEFDLAPQRAVTLALAELRLPPDTAPLQLEQVLPKPAVNPVENDLSRNALPYATALAGACPRLAPSANVLPVEFRRFHSRAIFIPTIALAAILLVAAGGMLVYSRYAEKQYLHELEAAIAKLQPQASRSAALERDTDSVRARQRLLQQYRGMTRNDLDALNELTRLMEPPAWTNAIDMAHDTLRITGESPEPTKLVNILDASPFFKNSNLDQQVHNPAGTEQFVISAKRGVR